MEEAIHTGKVLAGRYAVGERLGSGGWGSVYAAVHTGLGRPVAIEILRTIMATAGGALRACYAATELDPPDQWAATPSGGSPQIGLQARTRANP